MAPMKVDEITDFSELLNGGDLVGPESDCYLFNAKHGIAGGLLPSIPLPERRQVGLIGPEGDFTDEEVALARESNVRLIRLQGHTLRRMPARLRTP